MVAQELTLHEWMQAEGLKDEDVAEIVGKDKTSVWRVRTGKAKASFDFIEKVIVASHGRVTANSFFRRALHQAAASAPVPQGGGAPPPFSSASLTTPAASSGETLGAPQQQQSEWPLRACSEAEAVSR